MDRMNPMEIVFPWGAVTGYAVTSPATSEYDCVGWAAGFDTVVARD